jgi:hypothetical protein
VRESTWDLKKLNVPPEPTKKVMIQARAEVKVKNPAKYRVLRLPMQVPTQGQW